MLYVATERTSWLVIGIVLFAAGSYAADKLFAHVRERVDIWLHPWSQAQGHAYQLVQGLFGLGTGGVLGTGLGPRAVPTWFPSPRPTSSPRRSARSSASPG